MCGRLRVGKIARLTGSVPSHDHAVELQDPRLEHPQLSAERGEARARNLRHPFVTWISNDPEQLLNTVATDRSNDPELGKVRADHIDHRGPLPRTQGGKFRYLLVC